MLIVRAWGEEEFRANLTKRLAYAKAYRKNKYEDQWARNEEAHYNSVLGGTGAQSSADDINSSDAGDDFALSSRDVAVNYLSRDIRYLHAQMSANPPDVKVIPASVDMEDEERSEAADIVCRWAKERHKLQEISDQRNLKTLTKGTGYIRAVWDSTLGRPMDYNKETGELLMSGDTRIYSPSTWDIWLDPNARSPDTTTPDGVHWFFEEISMSPEEAVMRWPKQAEELKKLATPPSAGRWRFWEKGNNAERPPGEDQIKIYEYRERGEAVNGMAGRFAYMLENGKMLEWGANDHPHARLSLNILTDIDVEDEPYGKSVIEYLADVQEMIQNLDTNTLRNVAAHSVIRLYVDGNTTLSDEALSNDALEIIKGEGGAPPTFVNPPNQMADAWKLRDQLQSGSREVSMINEAMLGQASRETSGFTTQLQVNAGNMGRRRVFNKFTGCTKELYIDILALAVANWDEPRTIKVLGTERSYESHMFSSADIGGGWDIIANYGQNFSLDPNTARDQVLQLMPLFEKLEGFDYRSLVEAIRLNVMDNFIDPLVTAKRKQRRIFKDMMRRFEQFGTSAYIAPRELENHEQMIAYGREFVMTNEYDLLEDGMKNLIDQHIKDREQKIADVVAAAQPQGGAPAQPPMMPGLPLS